jgi:hypothetical protein
MDGRMQTGRSSSECELSSTALECRPMASSFIYGNEISGNLKASNFFTTSATTYLLRSTCTSQSCLAKNFSGNRF